MSRCYRQIGVVSIAVATAAFGLTAPALADAPIPPGATQEAEKANEEAPEPPVTPEPPEPEPTREELERRRLHARQNRWTEELGLGDFDQEKEIGPVGQFWATRSDLIDPLIERRIKLADLLVQATTTDKEIAEQLDEYKRGQQDEREWQEKAVKLLDELIGYSQQPRLEAALLVHGIVGDEAIYIDGMNTLFGLLSCNGYEEIENDDIHKRCTWTAGVAWPKAIDEPVSFELEELRRWQLAKYLQLLRVLMPKVGIIDKEVEKVVVAFLSAKDRARYALRDQTTRLRDTIAGAATGDALVPEYLAELRAGVAGEKLRLAVAEKKLDEKIGFAKAPRLEAALTVLGVIGERDVFWGFGSHYPLRKNKWGSLGGWRALDAEWRDGSMSEPIHKLQQGTREEVRARFSGLTKFFDSDGNGKVDRNERAQGKARMLKRFDRNGNGRFDTDEMMRAVDSF